MKRLGLLLCLGGAALAACSQAKSSGGGNSAGGAATATATASSTDVTTTSVAQPSATASADDITADNYPDGFYTGYDGGTDAFALLLPGFRTYTVADPTIAKIETVTVTVPQATIDSLTAAMKKLRPDAPVGGPDGKGFPTTQTMYRLTPLKPGTTTISAPNANPHGGGPGHGGGDVWSKGDTLTLVVSEYTTAQLAAGKARYTTDLDTSDQACASCHLTGRDGAPPHALGDINSIPDVAAAQWVTTGKLGGRTAKIPHAWKFADTNQEAGTIAYVRTLEATDPEQLIVLQFAQRFGLTVNSDGTLSAPTSTATSTTTTTGTTLN